MEIDIRRRATCAALPLWLGACANVPAGLARALDSVPVLGVFQGGAEIEMMLKSAVESEPIDVERVREIARRRLPPPSAFTYELDVMRLVIAATLLGDAETVLRDMPPPATHAFMPTTQAIFSLSRALMLFNAGRLRAAVAAADASARFMSQPMPHPMPAAYEQMSMATLSLVVDMGDPDLAERRWRSLPEDISHSGATPYQCAAYALERRRMWGAIARGHGDDAAAWRAFVEACAMWERGLPGIAWSERENYDNRLSVLLLSRTVAACSVGRLADAEASRVRLDGLYAASRSQVFRLNALEARWALANAMGRHADALEAIRDVGGGQDPRLFGGEDADLDLVSGGRSGGVATPPSTFGGVIRRRR